MFSFPVKHKMLTTAVHNIMIRVIIYCKDSEIAGFMPDNPSGRCAYLMNIYVRKRYGGESAGFSEMRDMMLLTYGK